MREEGDDMEVKTFKPRTKVVDLERKGGRKVDYWMKNEQIKEDWNGIRGKLAAAKFLIREIDGCESHVIQGDWKYDRVPRQLIKALYDYLWKDVRTYEYYCGGSTKEDRSSAAE